MKYKVCWRDNRNKIYNEHGVFNSFKEAYQSILDWWKQNDFDPGYVRYWTKGVVTTIDYGNHYCFYEIVEVEDLNDE